MASIGKLLRFADAMALLDDIAAANRDVYGADGFRTHPDGEREASLDLVLDVSGAMDRGSAGERIEKVRTFLIEHQASDIAWEIWAP